MNDNFPNNNKDFVANINQGNYRKIGQEQNYPQQNILNQPQYTNQYDSNIPSNMNQNMFIPAVNNYPNTNFNTNHIPNKMQIPNYDVSQNIYQTGPNIPLNINENNIYSYKTPDKFLPKSESNAFINLNNNNNNNLNIPNPKNIPRTNNLIYIDNRIATFNQYNSILLMLFIMSIFALFGSIFEFSSDNQRDGYMEIMKSRTRHGYDVLNFFVNLVHIAGYFYGMQAYNKQNSAMNRNFEMISVCLAAVNFIYLLIFIFGIKVTFFTWCVNIFWMLLNAMLYYSAKELSTLFEEKERIREQNAASF